MLSYRWFIAFGCITLLLSGCNTKQLSSNEIANQIDRSLVLIYYPDQPGHGTGFFVAGEKQVCTVLTVRHVVSVGRKAQVQTPDGKIWKDTKVRRFLNQDLAIVIFDAGGENCSYPALKLGDSDQVKRGDTIYIDGFPQRPGKLVKQFVGGSVTAIENTVDGYGISYQATTAGGMSGGPVVNLAAEVIAIHGRTDVELTGLAELKRETPPQQQSAASADPNQVGAPVGTFKWGIPSNIYKVNISGLGESSPTAAEDFLNSGNDLFISKRYQDSIAAYDKAIDIKPDYALAWLYRGSALWYLKRYDEAIASLDKAIQFKPDYSLAWYGRGYALGELKRYSEAIASYDKAIQFQPDYSLAWTGRGVALGNLKRYSEAIASYDKAIQVNSGWGDLSPAAVWLNRGNALSKLKRYSEAIASHDKAIQMKPDYYQAWHGKGFALENLKRYEEALASLSQATKIKPDYAEGWYNRGVQLSYLKRYEDAIASYDKAIQFQPDYSLAWNNRGNALSDLKRYDEAIASYDKAIQLKPDYSFAWNGKGAALELLKRYEQALECYDKAIKFDPNNQVAIDNRQKLLTKLARSR